MTGYKWDDLDFWTEWGVKVRQVDGHLDTPTRKRPTEYNYEDENGVQSFNEEDEIKVKARDITLLCSVEETTEERFHIKLAALQSFVLAPGEHDLRLKHGNPYSIYRVYHRSKTEMKFINKTLRKALFKIILRDVYVIDGLYVTCDEIYNVPDVIYSEYIG